MTGISGATSSAQYWRITTPAGKTLKIRISSGTGDADLYTRFGSRPTTSTYSCRPYLNGNSEIVHDEQHAGRRLLRDDSRLPDV